MKSLHIQPNQHQGERFPQILHSVLGVASGDTMISSIVSWTPDGKGFYIYDQRLFSDIILPIYFEGMNSYKSFRRQLNLYGITKQFDQCKRKTGVPSETKLIPYSHPMFLRDRRDLVNMMIRKRNSRANTSCHVKGETKNIVSNRTGEGSLAVSPQAMGSDWFSDGLTSLLCNHTEMRSADVPLPKADCEGNQDGDDIDSLILDYPTMASGPEGGICDDLFQDPIPLPIVPGNYAQHHDLDIQQEIIKTFCRKETSTDSVLCNMTS